MKMVICRCNKARIHPACGLGPLLLLMIAAGFELSHALPERFQLESRHIRVSYDNKMQRSISWLAAQDRNVLVSDPTAQEGVEILGRECTAFRLDHGRTAQRRVTDPEFGAAVEGTVTGTFEDDGRELTLERQTRILLPDDLPVALFQTSYRNLGKRPVHLDRIYSQRILLDRKPAEPEEQS